MKKTRILFIGLVVALILVAVPLLSAQAQDKLPPPIDPQSWQLLRDRTWDDFVPNPVIDWKKEVNPAGYYNVRSSSNRVSKIRGALVLFEYYDRPFITSQPLGSDVLGYYLYKEDGSGLDYEKGIVHNPVLNCERTLKESQYSTDHTKPETFQKDPVFANWWKDYLIGEHYGNHDSSQEEFYLENTYGKYHLQFEAFGPFEVPCFEFEIRDSYQGTTELPPSFRSPTGFSPTSTIDNHAFAIMQAKLDPASHRYFRNNFDFFHILHAGYDESGVWQEFGMGQFASRRDLPDELTPVSRMHKVEEVLTARPELLDTYINRYRNTSNAQIFRDAKALYEASLTNPSIEYRFKLSQADWDWANNWKNTTTRNTRYVNWTSWEAGVGEWSHMNSTTSFGTSMNYSTQGECDGMATFAHEFGHISGIGDNYGNPYTGRVTALTEPWELMSRGSFAGPFGDHARWTCPGIEGGSVPVHFMQTNKQSASCYDSADVLTITNTQLAARTPLITEIVARNVPLNNNKNTSRPNGLYPWLEADYGLVSPNYYKSIRMNFGSGTFADQAGTTANRKTTGFSWNQGAATRMAVEVVQRTGYDSFAPDDGVIISRNNQVVDAHNYDIALIDYMVEKGITFNNAVGPVDDYVSYTNGHAQQLYDGAFKAGKSVTDTGYYRSMYDPLGTYLGTNYYAREEARYYNSESSGVTWQKSLIKPGSIQQWEPRDGRPIASGDTVNEFHDPYNNLHFYILAKNTHEGKYGEFISYTIGMLHGAGVAVGGALNVEVADIEAEKPGRVAVASFDIINTGNAADIIRVAVNGVDGVLEAVLLNDLYAVGAGETVTVPVYYEIPAKIATKDVAGKTITFTAISESNKAKVGETTLAAEDLVKYNLNLYMETARSSVYTTETLLVDVMLKGDVNYTQVNASVAYDANLLEYAGYANLGGIAAEVKKDGADKITLRSVPSLNMIQGSSCATPVRIVTLKFTVKKNFEDSIDTVLTIPASILTPVAGAAVITNAKPLPLTLNRLPGNEYLEANVEKFPDMFDYETGQIKPYFSNDNNRVVQEVVWIEVPVDTDFDGQRDLQRVTIRRPIETLPENGGLVVPVIATLTPYQTNMSRPTFAAFSGRVDNGFVDQGPAATKFQHTRFNDKQQISGAENDLSYQALRDVTDKRVGKGADSHAARYIDLLTDGMLKATTYTAQQAADYPWLPPARAPQGKQLNGAPGTGPSSAGAWSAATYLPRGYAFVQVTILGSDYAQGMLQYGMYQESLCAAAVVDWLNGRIRAFTDPAGTIEVEAYWATGEVAASGSSYGGTLPIAAAITGVEGLRTIIPGAPVTNAYNYYRENGTPYAPGGWQGEDITSTTYYCFGRGWNAASPTHPTPQIWDTWWDWQLYLMTERKSDLGDFSPFWDERNPLSYGDDMRKDVGVIMCHGFNDNNVKFRHTALFNEMLKYYGVEVIKGLFNQGGHGLNNTRSGSWVQGNNLVEWTDHYLYGLENGITERMPDYFVESNLGTARWTEYDAWPAYTVYQKFYPTGGRVGALAATPQAGAAPLTFMDDLVPRQPRPEHDYVAMAATFDTDARRHILVNGVNNENGWLKNALIHAGQGSELASGQYDRWRNWLVGGLDATTAWSGNGRLQSSSASLTGSFDITKAIDDRLLFVMDIPQDFTISGTVVMTAEVAAKKDVGVISAMLVEWGSTVKIVAIGSVDVRNPNPEGTISLDVPGTANIAKGGNWHANYLFQPKNIIPYGEATPVAANFNPYTWEMDITEYSFSAGNKLGLIIFGSDPVFTYRPTNPTEFTVNVGAGTYLSLPMIKPITIVGAAAEEEVAEIIELVEEVVLEDVIEIIEEIIE